jgi:hypothetical protein
MIRVLTCFGMISVLLLTMASTGFVSTGYQKVNAATDFLTSDLGSKIRESIDNQISEELSPLSSPTSIPHNVVKITVSVIPGQTGESVTYARFFSSPGFPCPPTCIAHSDITIPGIGTGQESTTLEVHENFVHVTIGINNLPKQTQVAFIIGPREQTEPSFHAPLIIPNIAAGLATVELS